jgi:hypothetical protein
MTRTTVHSGREGVTEAKERSPTDHRDEDTRGFPLSAYCSIPTPHPHGHCPQPPQRLSLVKVIT